MNYVTSIAERAYQILLDGIMSRRWGGRLPCERKLAAELKIARMTLTKVLHRLEAEGHLRRNEKSGVRVVDAPNVAKAKHKRVLRVGVLAVLPKGNVDVWISDRITLLQGVEALGHTAVLVRYVTQPGAPRIARLEKLVNAACVDAWIVMAGSRPVLEWFEQRAEPVLAFGGENGGLSRVTGCVAMVSEAMIEATHTLLGLGHRRVVNVAPERFRKPALSSILTDFVKELKAAGVEVGGYHIPDWTETPEGLDQLLDSLFRFTPPTALIVWDEHVVAAVLGFLGRRGLRIPEDVSLIVAGNMPLHAWCLPRKQLAHLEYDFARLAQNAMNWVKHVAANQQPKSTYSINSKYVVGQTVGPPRP